LRKRGDPQGEQGQRIKGGKCKNPQGERNICQQYMIAKKEKWEGAEVKKLKFSRGGGGAQIEKIQQTADSKKKKKKRTKWVLGKNTEKGI